MSKILISLVAVTAIAIATPLAASAQPAPAKPYVVLDKNLGRLRTDFNANVGKVRMLYIVGPTCGICLRGMSDLQESLYGKKGNDARMVTFVVHVPTLGAREANVAPASHLISNRYTTQYWEESGIIGRRMQATIKADRYIWDFWAIYGPKAVWSDPLLPPAPNFWQHQLSGLPTDRRLDANVFASNVDRYLAQIPAAGRKTR